MTLKKIKQLVILNASIVVANIVVFSKAFLGLSFFSGSALGMTVSWFTALASMVVFFKRKYKIIERR